MKSHRMRRREEARQDFWPSFTDIMSCIALMMFFLMLITYTQNILRGRQLSQAETHIASLILEVGEKDIMLSEMDQTKITLAQALEMLEEQKNIIAVSNDELHTIQNKLQSVAALRLNIFEKITAAIESRLGSTTADGQATVSVIDNANIVINESLMFDYDSYVLNDAGKLLLAELADVFESILDNEDIRGNIDTIVIEGHSDARGTAEYNRELSSKRAVAVLNYVMSVNRELEQKYGACFAASAYSHFRPIEAGSDEQAMSKNRRIGISIVVKDEGVTEVINNYLNSAHD